MEPAQLALLLSLLGVALIHTRSRIAGAMAASAWCLAACAWGVVAFRDHGPLLFLGVAAPPWVYFVFCGGLFVFNAGVLAKALRRRARDRSGRGRDPGPAGS